MHPERCGKKSRSKSAKKSKEDDKKPEPKKRGRPSKKSTKDEEVSEKSESKMAKLTKVGAARAKKPSTRSDSRSKSRSVSVKRKRSGGATDVAVKEEKPSKTRVGKKAEDEEKVEVKDNYGKLFALIKL